MKKIFFACLSIVSLLLPHTAFAAGTGTFSWAQNDVSVAANAETTIQLKLSTGGNNTTGADAVLSYDPSKIEISSVTFSNPNLYSNNFFNNSVGTGVLKITSTFTDVSSSYNGSGNLALITLKGLQLGSTSLSWNCQDGSTNDSNILQQQSGDDVINCAGLTPLSITVTQGSSSGSTDTSTTTSNNAQGSGSGSCSALQSSPSNLIAKATSNTSVLLTWTKDPNANSYTLKYGTSPTSYQYGAANIGNSGSFSVNYLRAGTTYYFAVAGVNSCSTSKFITATAKTSAGASSAATPSNDTAVPSFDTIAAQVSQTQTSQPPAQVPVVDEKLNQGAPVALGQESFLPGKQALVETAAMPAKTGVSPMMIIGGAAVGIVVIGVGAMFFFRKPSVPVTPVESMPVETAAGGKPPTPIPPLA